MNITVEKLLGRMFWIACGARKLTLNWVLYHGTKQTPAMRFSILIIDELFVSVFCSIVY